MLLHLFLWRVLELQEVAAISVKDHAFRSMCTSLRYTELHCQKKNTDRERERGREKSSEVLNDKGMEGNAQVLTRSPKKKSETKISVSATNTF